MEQMPEMNIHLDFTIQKKGQPETS